jgi:hypothetical protein
MKKIYLLFGSALFVISICMIYLLANGVSLRSEPIIKPSPIDAQYQNITSGLLNRMFPEFQKTDYVVWGLSSNSQSEEATLFELLKNEHLAQFGRQPYTVNWTVDTTTEELKKCTKPCWIQIEKTKANSLKLNDSLQFIRSVLGDNYFSITFLEFERNRDDSEKVSDLCQTEKRLDFSCFLPISVREVQKYFKEKSVRYFFTRRYNEIDYFLFIEKLK